MSSYAEAVEAWRAHNNRCQQCGEALESDCAAQDVCSIGERLHNRVVDEHIRTLREERRGR